MRSLRSWVVSLCLCGLCGLLLAPAVAHPQQRLSSADLVYRGAFAFPAGDDWAYSGQALAYYPQGDPGGTADGCPGSLFAAGHAQMDLAGEMSIPAPQITDTFESLPNAAELRPLVDITQGLLAVTCAACATCECGSWEVDGLEYLDNIDRIAWNLRDWYNVGGEDLDSLGWSTVDMGDAEGVWHIGPRPNDEYPWVFHSAKTSNYLFKAPVSFANQHLGGMFLISGNHRLSGSPGGAQGPSLFAMAPWLDGDPPDPGQDLDAVALVYYPWVLECTENDFEQCHFPGYRVDDHWGGGAWVDTGERAGIIIAGRKGLGDNCYGIPDQDCQSSLCSYDHGWHSDPYEPQILFYDPAEIAEVAAGTREPWEVLPYEVYRPSTEVFDPDCGELSSVAYDPDRQLVFIAEYEAGPWGETAVHVWQVEAASPTAPVAAFSWSPEIPRPGETVSFSDQSTGLPSSWSWTFGDGGTASTANPIHSYAVAGSFTVSITVSNTVGSDSVSHLLTVRQTGDGPPITDPGDFVYVIPASAKVGGAGGTNWVTDAVLNNDASAALTANLFFLERGLDNSTAVAVETSVPATASAKVEDIVSSVFSRQGTSGAIVVGADQPLAVTSRTYNDQGAAGTYGQFIPGFSIDDAIEADEPVRLVQLTRNGDFRTNAGFVNLTDAEITVEVSLYAGGGQSLGDESYDLEPFEYYQDNDLLGELDWQHGDAFARVVSHTAGARFMTYASVIDNRTGDPIFIPAMR